MDMKKRKELRAKKKRDEGAEENVSKFNINWDRQIYVPIALNPYK